jgi:hypothetical protein
MQGRMMEKMQLQPEAQLNEPEHVRVESWQGDVSEQPVEKEA